MMQLHGWLEAVDTTAAARGTLATRNRADVSNTTTKCQVFVTGHYPPLDICPPWLGLGIKIIVQGYGSGCQGSVWKLWSASTEQLDVPTCRRSTVGGRTFPVAGTKVWNGLPSDVTSASSLSVFKNRLKTCLFRRCYETLAL